jgi:hypothetical protein
VSAATDPAFNLTHVQLKKIKMLALCSQNLRMVSETVRDHMRLPVELVFC